MAIIYKITSNTSNKSYIELTNTTIYKRFKNHINSSNNGSPYHFHRAIQKYGIDDFSIEIIEILKSASVNKFSPQ